MERTRVVGLALAMLLVASAAAAQGLSGTVVDPSGAVLPGVTVEAASPALIERMRTAVTDAAGVYRIIELRPGTYSVTFGLPGFQTVKREGVELSTGFTATVNATLSVGALQETVTVTGVSPVVDTQNTVVQTRLGRQELEALPLGQSLAALQTLTLGVAGRDVGGDQAENQQSFGVRGVRGGDFQIFRDGMSVGSYNIAGNSHASTNPSMFEEVAINTGGTGATGESLGVAINMISRTGSNVFRGSGAINFAHSSLQSSNLDDALRARGVTAETSIRKRYDVHGSVGGPIARDRLWFIGGARYWVASDFLPGNFFDATAGTLFYTPDPSRPAFSQTYWRMGEGRLTWQASQRNQFTGMFEMQKNCDCYRGLTAGNVSPEASGHHLPTMTRGQGQWTSPVTSRLLLQFGTAYQLHRIDRAPGLGGSLDHRSITELSTGYTYGGYARIINQITNIAGYQTIVNANQNLTMSYVTGRHSFQVGARHLMAEQDLNPTRISGPIDDAMTFAFRNGVPESFTLFALPFRQRQRNDLLSIFASDQWTISRLTINAGVRFESLRGSVPPQDLAAGLYVPARSFPGHTGLPNLKDLDPRVGLAYDVFGTGKTAVKVHVARGVWQETQVGTRTSLGQLVNPVTNIVTSATRPWTDLNGNYYPDCDLRNPVANSECGPLSDRAFGTAVRTRFFADEIFNGWFNRGYTWQGSLSVQQELAPGLSADIGYFRTWHGNFRVEHNVLTTPADYDPYCVTAPSDSRLPGGGGFEICGLFDIKPEKFGLIETHIVPASRFGDESQVYNGVEAKVNLRRGRHLLSGGVISGAEVRDRCYVVNSPQELRNCRVAPSWSAGTQVKLHGITSLPHDVQLSGAVQVLPSVAAQANHRFTTAEIRPSLGRNLSGGVRNVNVAMFQPESIYLEGWSTQVDLRVARVFRLGAQTRIVPAVDLYNLLNANPVLRENNTFGPTYRNAQSVLGPRVVRLGAQLDF